MCAAQDTEMPVATMTGRMAASETATTPSGGAGGGRRGRRPASVSFRAKLERSRQSARECRARKKLRYQYLEELVTSREKAIFALRDELKTFKDWCIAVDSGEVPPKLLSCLAEHRERAKRVSSCSSDGGGDAASEGKSSITSTAETMTFCQASLSPSSHGLQQQDLPVTKIRPVEISSPLPAIKPEPDDTRWIGHVQMPSSNTELMSHKSVTTSVATDYVSDYNKVEFVSESVDDLSFEPGDETVTLSDVFEFDEDN